MRKSTRDRISKWLLEVEDPAECQISPGPPVLATQLNKYQLFEADLPGPGGQGNLPTGEKEGVDPPSTFLVPERPSAPHQIESYERRPRHKTRPDRYEYKGQPTIKKGRKKEKQTWSKMKRKRTMNVDFHAPNVAQTRLTLHAGLNTGLFQKGKTSPPVKPREVPDLAFSEMKFLSNQSQVSYKPAARDDRRKAHKKPQKPDYDTRFGEPALTPNPLEQDSRFLSEAVVSAPRYGHPPSACPSKSDHPENPKKRKRSSPSTPYTWSSKQGDSTGRDEQCLRILMQVNPNAQKELPRPDLTKMYWDIEGLKGLLKERKMFWNLETEHDGLSNDRASNRRRCSVQVSHEASQYSNQSGRAPVRATPLTHQTKLDPKETDVLRESLSAPRSTFQNVAHNNQAYHHMRHGSPYPGQYDEHQVDTGIEYHPGAPISQSHFYPRPQHVDLSHRQIGRPMESEMSWVETWIETFCLPELNRRRPGIDEDEERFIRYLDAVYDRIIRPDDSQHIPEHLMEDAYAQEGKTVATGLQYVPEPPIPWPHGPQPRLLKPYGFANRQPRTIIDSPHFVRPPIPEQHSILLEPYGFVDEWQPQLIRDSPHFVRPPLPEPLSILPEPYGVTDERQSQMISESPHFVRPPIPERPPEGQHRSIGESPHFVRPPLPVTLLRIDPGEEIRLRNPRPGIPHEPQPTSGAMAGFWRENKLY